MNYRRRLARDLEDWIGRGLIPASSREPILESVGAGRRFDATTALAVVGALLAGVAAIAFVAANWAAIPRVVRFSMILVAFLASAGGAAWASALGREITRQALLSLAALVFAAAIGLTGQIFDIVGDPQTALRFAGLGAVLLALAGRSPWAAAVAIALFVPGDFTSRSGVSGGVGWVLAVAPLGAILSVAWRSQALAHAAGMASLMVAPSLMGLVDDSRRGEMLLVASVLLAVAAFAARYFRGRVEEPVSVLYGWWTLGALAWFGAYGFTAAGHGVEHSVVWLALSIGVLVLGRADRHAPVTGIGILSLFAAGASLLFSLGVGLLTSAAVFGVAAIVALGTAFLMRRSRTA